MAFPSVDVNRRCREKPIEAKQTARSFVEQAVFFWSRGQTENRSSLRSSHFS
jgi:hypothetical protein